MIFAAITQEFLRTAAALRYWYGTAVEGNLPAHGYVISGCSLILPLYDACQKLHVARMWDIKNIKIVVGKSARRGDQFLKLMTKYIHFINNYV